MAVPTTGQTQFSSVSGGAVALLVVVNGLVEVDNLLLVLASGVVDVMGIEVDGSEVESVDLFVGNIVVCNNFLRRLKVRS